MAIHIRRREIIVTLGSGVVWPLAARAQQPRSTGGETPARRGGNNGKF
jgi:hypothetical protein